MAKTFEERLESKYIRHLRKEIAKLKRENQQLRKKVRRQEFELEENSEILLDANYLGQVADNKKERVTCAKCGSYDVQIFKSGLFDFYKCSCGSKGRLNKTIQAS